MRRLCGAALILALVSTGIPVAAAGAKVGMKAGQAEGTGRIAGTAKDAKNATLRNSQARLRDVNTGQIAGQTTTNANGQFSFAGLNPGTYIVEIVSSTGLVVATTSTISLTVGAMVATGVTVTATAAAAAAAGAGAGAAAAGAAAAGGGFFSSTAGIIVLAAAGAGVAGGIAVAATASPSR